MSKLEDILAGRLDKFVWTGGDWAKSFCPFHKETRPSFTINMESGWFHCYGCQASGPIQLLLRKLGYRHHDLDNLIRELQQYKKKKKKSLKEPTTFLPEHILAAYERCPTSLLDAGFDKNLLYNYQVGYDTYEAKITFPVRDIYGRLVAISGRTIGDDSPKYKFYTFRDTFPDYTLDPSGHLWGAEKLMAKYQAGGKIERIIVCEGFKAALWCVQQGFDAVALMRTAIVADQLSLLKTFYKPIVLFLDNDMPGRVGTARASKKIMRYVPSLKIVDYPAGKKQPDDCSGDEVKNLIKNAKNPLTLEVHKWITEKDSASVA